MSADQRFAAELQRECELCAVRVVKHSGAGTSPGAKKKCQVVIGEVCESSGVAKNLF